MYGPTPSRLAVPPWHCIGDRLRCDQRIEACDEKALSTRDFGLTTTVSFAQRWLTEREGNDEVAPGYRWPKEGPAFALNFTPILAIPGAGIPAHFTGLDPRPAYAIHGGTMLGLNLFVVGAMVDGRHEKNGVRAGPVAITAGVLGAAAGSWLGATQIHDERQGEMFLAGPPVGGMAGLLIGGLAALAVPDSDTQFRRVLVGGSVGMGLGFLVSGAFARTEGASSRRRSSRRLPQLSTGRSHVLVSYGGSF